MINCKPTFTHPCIRKEERSKIININFYYRKLEKQKKYKPKASRRKEIMKIDINEIENHTQKTEYQ